VADSTSQERLREDLGLGGKLSERSEARFALDGIRDGLGVIPGEIVPDSWS